MQSAVTLTLAEEVVRDALAHHSNWTDMIRSLVDRRSEAILADLTRSKEVRARPFIPLSLFYLLGCVLQPSRCVYFSSVDMCMFG